MSRPPFQPDPPNASAQRRAVAAHLTSGVLLSPDVLESLPDAIVAVDAAGTIVQINSQAEELFGYDGSELVGQRVEVLVPENYRSEHTRHRDSYAATPRTRRMGANLNLSGRRRDGSEFPVEISLSPVETGKGLIVLSAIRDISERQRMEDELRRANEELYRRTVAQLGEYRSRLASIIDSSNDAIIGEDTDGTITSWNRGAETMYGYRPEEVVGKNISLLAPTDRADEIPGILRRIAQGETVENLESMRVTKDGRRLDVSISVSPLFDAAGRISGASAIARDVTRQKRIERQLEQSQRLEAVGRLAGGVAHDFNNILGIINACTEFLRDRLEPDSEPSVYVDNIAKSIERGTSLTRQLLAFSRNSAMEPRILDLNEHLRGVTRLLRPLLGDDIEVLVVPRVEAAIIEADPGKIDQVVINLAVNARDAMPTGGKLILETTIRRFEEDVSEQGEIIPAGNYVQMAVSDTGSGMDAATMSHIFEPFFTTKETGKGTGLGLATVYGIVRQNHGQVRVYSEPGHGTTFRVYLPNVEGKLGLTTKDAEAAPAEKVVAKRILLVEDDPIMRSLTKKGLEESGYLVAEAEDGQAALELLEAPSEAVDLLLTDVVMRGASGPELAEQLQRKQPGLRVVFMSGYTGELIAERRVLGRGVRLLEKPFTRTALLKAIQDAFRGD